MATATNPTKTKKYKALVAVLGSDEAARVAWNHAHPDNQIGETGQALPENVQKLVDAGFSVEEAKSLVGTPSQPVAVAPLTSQEQGEALVGKAGLVPVRGRIYATGAIIEAQVRVLKTGKPELIRNEGTHRTKAVLIYRTDDGLTAAVQNLGVPN